MCNNMTLFTSYCIEIKYVTDDVKMDASKNWSLTIVSQKRAIYC